MNTKSIHLKHVLIPGISLFVSLLIAIHFYYGFTLIDHYTWRQTQTAMAIREFVRGGPFFEYRVPVLTYPWAIPLEFPLYQYLSAKLSLLTNLDIETSARIISFAAFSGFILFFGKLLKTLNYPNLLITATLLLTIFSPLYLYWSHSVMIETFTLFFGMLYIYSATRLGQITFSSSKQFILFLAVLNIIGGLALLTKITTGIPALVIGGSLYLYQKLSYSNNNRLQLIKDFFTTGIRFVIFNIGALCIGIAWLIFTDTIKQSDPTLLHQSSTNFAKFGQAAAFKSVFGTLSDGLFYTMFSAHILGSFKFWILIIAIIGCLSITLYFKQIKKEPLKHGFNIIVPFAALTLFFIIPIMFGSLYKLHYYYWVANSYLCIFFVTCGLYVMTRFLPKKYADMGYSVLIITILVSMGFSYKTNYLNPSAGTKTWWMAERHALVDYLTTNVSEPGLLAISGISWEPTVPYYTDRYAFMALPNDYAGLSNEISRRQALIPKGEMKNVASLLHCHHNNAPLDAQQVFTDFDFSTKATVHGCDIYH